ncbi:MAG: ATP-binding cassette domain-containing protein [Planctomycetes bacterium]|nr:ATP-binding cassette domain-containing protein [Planctomycetota bacterium]
MNDVAVSFDRVSKRFRLGETHRSLRDLEALEGVSFSVARGEALGVIGPNGAGKSTVLKLLAGILRPDRGGIRVVGRVAPLIEVGAGFHGDLSGRENIFLNGAILGMSRAEIRGKLDAIVNFAGLERFLDTPVKRYSSGMYARLGFSIAAHVDPDVLLVDEVLSVGDAVFRIRCLERMRRLIEGGTTLIFVTHQLEQMQTICRRAMVLDGGRKSFEGPAREAVGHYTAAMSRAWRCRSTDVIESASAGTPEAELLALRVVDAQGAPIVETPARRPFRVDLRLRLSRPVPRLVVELNMRATPEENLLSCNSGRAGRYFNVPEGIHDISLRLSGLPVRGGQYFWNLRLWDAQRSTTLLDTPFGFPLMIDDEGRAAGTLCVDHEWQFAGRVTAELSGFEPVTPAQATAPPRPAPASDREPQAAIRPDQSYEALSLR